MDFAFTPEQEQIRAAIERVCAPYDADYWLRKDRERGFPVIKPSVHRWLAHPG
jgi:acyl-CoA dehydrogenase